MLNPPPYPFCFQSHMSISYCLFLTYLSIKRHRSRLSDPTPYPTGVLYLYGGTCHQSFLPSSRETTDLPPPLLTLPSLELPVRLRCDSCHLTTRAEVSRVLLPPSPSFLVTLITPEAPFTSTSFSDVPGFTI